MAYMSQEMKAELTPGIKAVLAKYGVKASISVVHHMKLTVNIKSSKLDLITNYIETINRKREMNREELRAKPDYLSVNYFHIDENFTGECAAFLNELKTAMMVGNHNNSDSMTDYFDVGWYISINVGRWDKPYIFEG